MFLTEKNLVILTFDTKDSEDFIKDSVVKRLCEVLMKVNKHSVRVENDRRLQQLAKAFRLTFHFVYLQNYLPSNLIVLGLTNDKTSIRSKLRLPSMDSIKKSIDNEIHRLIGRIEMETEVYMRFLLMSFSWKWISETAS